MLQASSTNPYGCIFKSAEMAKTLHSIWKPRLDGTDLKISVGIISDGSLGTISGKIIKWYYLICWAKGSIWNI